MLENQNPNLLMLMLAVDMLGDLVDEMVLVGGCATGLFINDPTAAPIRVTRDVDAIVEVSSLIDYYKLSEKLHTRGFKEDTSEDAPICRWVNKEIILDVMPSKKEILGFGNDFYTEVIGHAKEITLPNKKIIRSVSAPYFLITKLIAFDDRGANDYRASHDLEDIISVIDGCTNLIDEIKECPEMIRNELGKRFTHLLQQTAFVDSLSGHLLADSQNQIRLDKLLERIRSISLLGN